MRKFKAEYITSGIFLCIIIVLMFSAVCAYAWKKINDRLNPPEEKQEIKIDWEAMYPFEAEVVKENKDDTIFDKIYENLKKKFEDYSSKNLIGYYSIVESAKQYEEFTGWNMASVFEYNAVVKLHDGYLTTYTRSRDVTINANATIELAEFCRQRGIDFFYANLPKKVCI
ncbi:MAG: hypothetical protein IJP97_02755, partial [Synergistaceae bacterium]|nr:hypothetical protein [Synergistaceae bacterium]